MFDMRYSAPSFQSILLIVPDLIERRIIRHQLTTGFTRIEISEFSTINSVEFQACNLDESVILVAHQEVIENGGASLFDNFPQLRAISMFEIIECCAERTHGINSVYSHSLIDHLLYQVL